jgi:CDP-diglyceride synthetase
LKEELNRAFLLVLPVVMFGIMHMIAVRIRFLQILALPVCELWFGKNKTWRGFILMPLFGASAFCTCVFLFKENYVVSFSSNNFSLFQCATFGALLGFAYVLGELPNSYIKRRMGIPPGEQATKKKALFFMLDHIDSLTTCLVCYFFLFPLNWTLVFIVCALAPLVHIFVNLLLYQAKLRKTMF